MFTLTVSAADWTKSGSAPSSGSFELEFAKPFGEAPVITARPWKVALQATGSGQWGIPTIPASNALILVSRVSGLHYGEKFYFRDPGSGSVSLTQLIETFQIDPVTLEPVTSAPTIGEALADVVSRVGDLEEHGVPANPSGGAGGALAGQYPNPGLNEWALFNLIASALQDPTNPITAAVMDLLGSAAPGAISVIDNGDGTFSASGQVVEIGDGSFSLPDTSAVTDFGDGTYMIAA